MNNIMIQGTTMVELQVKIEEILHKQICNLKTNKEEGIELLTREEAAKFLRVSYMTLHNWAKHNILTPNKIGTRVYYKKSDIENAMIPLTA